MHKSEIEKNVNYMPRQTIYFRYQLLIAVAISKSSLFAIQFGTKYLHRNKTIVLQSSEVKIENAGSLLFMLFLSVTSDFKSAESFDREENPDTPPSRIHPSRERKASQLRAD